MNDTKTKGEDFGEHCSPSVCALIPVGETDNKNRNVNFWNLDVNPNDK